MQSPFVMHVRVNHETHSPDAIAMLLHQLPQILYSIVLNDSRPILS